MVCLLLYSNTTTCPANPVADCDCSQPVLILLVVAVLGLQLYMVIPWIDIANRLRLSIETNAANSSGNSTPQQQQGGHFSLKPKQASPQISVANNSIVSDPLAQSTQEWKSQQQSCSRQ